MATTADASTQLQPLLVTLSALHLPPPTSALHYLSGIELFLPNSDTAPPIRFKAIITECTSHSLLLKSFYEANICGKAFNGTEIRLSPMATLGISHCAFTTRFSMMTGNDQMAPQFDVEGVSRISFAHQGYFFRPSFMICDHIFCRQEYETQFVAVLGLDFLREYFIRAQPSEKGWMIQLPPPSLVKISELLVFTSGCCLHDGKAAYDPEAPSALGGYGIHFPTLPNGWDMYGPLASDEPHTNQNAELIAVIRALQIVRLRKIPCEKISIFSDAKYAVDGLNDGIPNLRLSNGYPTAGKRVFVNVDIFRSFDEEVSLSTENGVPMTLNHVPREQNRKAFTLSKRGAASSRPSMTLSYLHKGTSKGGGNEARANPEKHGQDGRPPKAGSGNGKDGRLELILGEKKFDRTRPLVQWSPDGDYLVEWQPNESSGERLEAPVV